LSFSRLVAPIRRRYASAAETVRNADDRRDADRGTRRVTIAVQTKRAVWYENRWNQLILGLIAMMAISSPGRATLRRRRRDN